MAAYIRMLAYSCLQILYASPGCSTSLTSKKTDRTDRGQHYFNHTKRVNPFRVLSCNDSKISPSKLISLRCSNSIAPYSLRENRKRSL